MVGLVVEAPSAGDDAQPGVAGGAVDLPGREVVLAVLVHGVDPEGGHGAVGAGDVDLVTGPQRAEAEEHAGSLVGVDVAGDDRGA